jgi:hypothetical protein
MMRLYGLKHGEIAVAVIPMVHLNIEVVAQWQIFAMLEIAYKGDVIACTRAKHHKYKALSSLPRRSSTTTTLDRIQLYHQYFARKHHVKSFLQPCDRCPKSVRTSLSHHWWYVALTSFPSSKSCANVALQAQLVSAHLPSPSSLRRTLRTSSSAAEIRSEPPNSSPKSGKPRHPPSSLFSNVTFQVLPLCNHRPRSSRPNQTV